MQSCPSCASRMSRAHRTRLQKVLYFETFVCPKCHLHVSRYHSFLSLILLQFRFIFSGHTRCIRCGQESTVHRIDRRDKLDPFTRNPLALFQKILGAPIAKCTVCRLQYYDWRKARPGGV